MPKRYHLRIAFLWVFIGWMNPYSHLPGKAGDEGWQLAKDVNGIRVYTRSVEGLNVNEFKAITTVDASLSAIVAVFTDVPSYPTWLFNCIAAEVLERNAPERFKYHLETKAPFPFDNRDMVQQLSIQQNPDTKVVRVQLENLPAFIDTIDGIVRMPVAEGFWVLKPLSAQQVELTFQYRFDPGGNIPAWAVNMFLVKSPYETLTNLRERLKEEKYLNATISWIENG